MTTTIGFARMVAGFSADRLARYDREVLPLWDAQGIDAHEVLDLQQIGAWETCRRAWRVLAENWPADILCVLQDDFVPCDHFLPRLKNFLTTHQTYSAWGIFQPATHNPEECRLLMAAHKDFELSSEMICWGGALVLRREIVNPVLQLAEHFGAYGIHNDDLRLSRALRYLNIPIMQCSPSILRHVGAYWPSLCQNGFDNPQFLSYRAGYTLAGELKNA